MALALRLMRYAAAAAVLAALFALPARAATTWHVDSASGNDGNDCMSAATACQTIQAAIDKASAGDTIIVEVGTYPEPAVGPLTVNKKLTLQGAQAGVDGRTRSAAESVITDSQGTSVSASGVIIDGFTVQGSTNPAFTGFGIDLSPGVSGTQILNNIIQDNIVGIGLANTGTLALIKHNLIQNNNQQPGIAASGTGIYTDQFVGGPNVANVLITANKFSGNDDAGFDSSNTDFLTGGVSNVVITDNKFDSDGRSVVLFNTHGMTFDGNSVTNSTLTGSAAFRVFDNNTDLTVTNNDLITGVFHGIRISDPLGFPSSRVKINENNIENFRSGDGLLVDMGSTTDTVDATCNWWNDASGPTNPTNPGGTGEKVEGDADFTPWLVAPAPSGACHGGVPSTPGKVTGGGQVEGDPVFSALGALLSAPAVIPSAAGLPAQATFGFVVQCCPARGNLQYDDHTMGVTINAKSIDFLAISGSSGTSCPAVPGSQHAEFTGTATVKRSTGTATQPFTVDVDDCGEPGTMDTFKIQTTGYVNGGTLIGGNIQIHKS